MNLHYKIVEVWPDDHLIVVRYWTDVLSEESLASDQNRNEDGTPVRCRSDVSLTLPIPVPEESALQELILAQAPFHWLKTLEDVLNPEVDTSVDHIKSLLGKKFTKENLEKSLLSVPKDLTDEEIEDLINSITVKQ